MPELYFQVRWPDATTTRCYSPSSTTRNFFTPGEAYPLTEFVRLCRDALTLASERVAQRYGYTCSSAAGQLAQIEQRAAAYQNTPDAEVTVLGFDH